MLVTWHIGGDPSMGEILLAQPHGKVDDTATDVTTVANGAAKPRSY